MKRKHDLDPGHGVKSPRILQDAEHSAQTASGCPSDHLSAPSLVKNRLRNIVLNRVEQNTQKSGAKTQLNTKHDTILLSDPIQPSISAAGRPSLPVNGQHEVLDAFNNITTTPFESSFLSRLQGTRPGATPGITANHAIFIDWDSVTPWMRLMEDIRDHHFLASAESDENVEHPSTKETSAPITYTTLQPSHLAQVHDLLERAFWSGIDEKATVIAVYKKLVVGVAILSSPQETYITFLAVRTGWDNSQIAKTMLYLLVTRNPGKDMTLHVSVNNSAMLLYNQFGFKAEEFVAGFYEDYLDPLSRASKNAFKLRLRH